MVLNRKQVWLLGGGLLMGVWLIATVTLVLLNMATPTPEKIIATIETTNLQQMTPPQRKAHVEQLARQINQLPMDQREQPHYRETLRSHFQDMTRDERSLFIELTISNTFRHVFERINNMPREERQRFVERAVNDMRQRHPREADADFERAREEIGEDALQKIIDEGFRGLMRDASAEAKMDLAPLIEQMQRQMQRRQ